MQLKFLEVSLIKRAKTLAGHFDTEISGTSKSFKKIKGYTNTSI